MKNTFAFIEATLHMLAKHILQSHDAFLTSYRNWTFSCLFANWSWQRIFQLVSSTKWLSLYLSYWLSPFLIRIVLAHLSVLHAQTTCVLKTVLNSMNWNCLSLTTLAVLRDAKFRPPSFFCQHHSTRDGTLQANEALIALFITACFIFSLTLTGGF